MSAPLSSGAQALIEHARREGRRALADGMAAGLVLMAGFMLFGARSVLWPLALGYYVYFRKRRVGRLLLWLRKFREPERGRIRFSVLLSRACIGLALPVTLQDSSFKASYLASGTRWVLSLPIVFGTGALIPIVAMLAWLFTRDSASEATATTTAVTVGLFLFALWLMAIRLLLRRGGYQTLDREHVESRLEKVVSQIRRRKSVPTGVLVLKCDDASWRDVVSRGLQAADVIVIDVSEPSTNVLWELQAASRLEPQRPIVLACQRREGDPDGLPREILERVRDAVGESKASGWRVVSYPANDPGFGRANTRMFDALVLAFREAIAEGLSTAAPEAIPETRGRFWDDFITTLGALGSALFVVCVLFFGPYDARNAREALVASFVLAIVPSFLVMAWLQWRRRRGRGRRATA